MIDIIIQWFNRIALKLLCDENDFLLVVEGWFVKYASVLLLFFESLVWRILSESYLA